jgi:hypothetical protein
MDKAEAEALARIAKSSSVEDLRKLRKNALGRSDAVRQAALERLIDVSASNYEDPVARDCWRMVFTIEEIRRDAGKVWRMNHLRPKIAREGERAALEYCAVNRTDGFEEVIGYGLPHLTAEAIVQAHPDAFDAKVRQKAAARLEQAGVRLEH